MKTIVPLICTVLAFGAGSLCGAPVEGDQLEIGGAGSNQVDYGLGAAIGSGNYVWTPGAGSLALGNWNEVVNEGSAAIGLWNEVGGWCSLALGTNNLIDYNEEEGSGNFALLVGQYNYLNHRAGASIVSGLNNYVGSLESSLYLDATATFGRGLINLTWKNATLVGQYNSYSEILSQPLLFAVGNGSDANNRSNAFTVFKNGAVEVGGSPVLTSSSFPGYLGTLPSTSDQILGISASAIGAGRKFTIQAGAAASGSSDQPGGTLVLSGGASTGTRGSTIEFQTAASGTSGIGIRTPETRMKINPAGGIEAGVEVIAAAAPQFVLGKYNNTEIGGSDGPGNHGEGLFIIGAGPGTGTPARKNAMRVLDDGTILIRQKGDLPMDGFNQGEQP